MTHDDARPADPARECGACPLCAGLAALRQARPEAVEHLVKAGTELLLAVRARVLLEGPASDGRREPRPAGARMRRIDVG
jgi:hypothetical protein